MKTARPDRIRFFSSVCPGKMESTGQMSCRVLSWPTMRISVKLSKEWMSRRVCQAVLKMLRPRSAFPLQAGLAGPDLQGAGGRRWSDYLSLPTCRLGWNKHEKEHSSWSGTFREYAPPCSQSHSFHFNFRSAAISRIFSVVSPVAYLRLCPVYSPPYFTLVIAKSNFATETLSLFTLKTSQLFNHS